MSFDNYYRDNKIDDIVKYNEFFSEKISLTHSVKFVRLVSLDSTTYGDIIQLMRTCKKDVLKGSINTQKSTKEQTTKHRLSGITRGEKDSLKDLMDAIFELIASNPNREIEGSMEYRVLIILEHINQEFDLTYQGRYL